MSNETEAAILSRIIEPRKAELPSQLAREVLRWQFTDADRQRMRDLLEKAKAGKLTRREKVEAENYERVGHFLSIMKSKARVSLKSKNGSA